MKPQSDANETPSSRTGGQHFDEPGNVPIPDPSLMTTRQLQREVFGLRELLEVKLGAAMTSINDVQKILEARLDGMDASRQSILATLRDQLEAKAATLDNTATLTRTVIETRLTGMDKAIELLQAAANMFPLRVDEKIAAVSAVHDERFDSIEKATDEKFSSIQTQFVERDVRTEQAAGAVKIAVDAALQAQKEAAGEASRSNATAATKSEASFTKQIDLLTVTIQTITKAFDDKIASGSTSATNAINDVKDRVNRMEGGWGGATQIIGWVIAAIGILIGLSRFLK